MGRLSVAMMMRNLEVGVHVHVHVCVDDWWREEAGAKIESGSRREARGASTRYMYASGRGVGGLADCPGASRARRRECEWLLRRFSHPGASLALATLPKS